MPSESRLAYIKQWKQNNKEKVKEYDKTTRERRKPEYNTYHRIYSQKQTVKKRCPNIKCNRIITLRKYYKTVVCEHCGTKIKIGKTLSVSNKNAHGLKLQVV